MELTEVFRPFDCPFTFSPLDWTCVNRNHLVKGRSPGSAPYRWLGGDWEISVIFFWWWWVGGKREISVIFGGGGGG